MSVQLSVFVGFAVKLDYKLYKDNKELEKYEYIYKETTHSVFFVSDGMNGEYIYLINPKAIVQQEDLYRRGCEHQITNLKLSDKKEMKRLYRLITGTELNDEKIQMLMFAHCW